ncbi:MAG: GNAT family N-acetyltransferase [Calditrichota bacterium]
MLRPLAEVDQAALYAVAKDPLIWEQHPCPDRWRKKEFDAFFQTSLDSEGALVVIENSTANIIGSSRFKPVDGHPNAVEIGWSFLARKFWGGTYNRAVKQLMINHAMRTLEHVIFYIGTDNIRSQKAVEKIGAVQITDDQDPLKKKSDVDLTYVINRYTTELL